MSGPFEELGAQLGRMGESLRAIAAEVAAGIERGRAAFLEAQARERERLARERSAHLVWLETPEGQVVQLRNRIAGWGSVRQSEEVAEFFTARAHRELDELLARIYAEYPRGGSVLREVEVRLQAVAEDAGEVVAGNAEGVA